MIGLAGCSDDEAADDATTTTESPEAIGSLTFDGTTYDLTESDCEVADDGLSRWFAFDAEGDVEVAVYGGEDAETLSVLVHDGHESGPAWEADEPGDIELDGDESSIQGSATVTPSPVPTPDDVDAPAEDEDVTTETVTFEFRC